MSRHIIAQIKFISSAFCKFMGRRLVRRRKDQALDDKIKAIDRQEDQAPDGKIKAIDALSLTQAPH